MTYNFYFKLLFQLKKIHSKHKTMKKLLFLGIIICLAFAQNSFAQLTTENMVGRWRVVDFNMVPKKANGKLTKNEITTIETMKKALALKPKLMIFTLNTDGSTIIEPKPEKINPTWSIDNSIITFKYGRKKSEQYSIKLLNDGKTEWQALKSKVALPVMIFEKD